MDRKQLEELEERERLQTSPPSQLSASLPESREPVVDEGAHWRSVPTDPVQADPNYVPAETWDGLERVGFSGHWRDLPVTVEEAFIP
jgi:hypothetical protein